MAVDSSGRLAGHTRHAAPLHPGGRQGAARERATFEPLVEHSAVRHGSWTDDVVDAAPERARRSRSTSTSSTIASTSTPSTGTVRSLDLVARPSPSSTTRSCRMLADLGVATDIWAMPVEIAGAIPFPDDRVARELRPRRRSAVLARARRDGARLQGVPQPVRRQVQPGALVLGSARPRAHSVLRTSRAAASGRRPQLRART